MVLSDAEVEAFKLFAGAFRRASDGQGIQPRSVHRMGCFEVKAGGYLYSAKKLGRHWTALYPLNNDCLREHLQANVRDGFLKKDAMIIQTRIISFLSDMSEKHPNSWQHLLACIVAAEFKCWVTGPSFECPEGFAEPLLIRINEPTEDARKGISERVALIGCLLREEAGRAGYENGITEFTEFSKLLGFVEERLNQILVRWPCYIAQVSVNDMMRNLQENLENLLRSCSFYCFYVLRDGNVGKAFDPATFNNLDEPICANLESAHATLSGKIMQQLLEDSSVRQAVSNEECCGASYSFPRLDNGLCVLAGTLGIPQLDGMPDQLNELLIHSAESGLTKPEVCGMSEQEFKDAIDCFLALHTAVSCLARCREMIKSLERLSALGGELLLSSKTPKLMLEKVMTLTREGLEAVAENTSNLDKLLKSGHMRLCNEGKTSRLKNSSWEKNRIHSEEFLRRLRTTTKDSRHCVDEVTSKVMPLDPCEVLQSVSLEAKRFRSVAQDVFKTFHGWRQFTLPQQEMRELFEPQPSALPGCAFNAFDTDAPSTPALMNMETFTAGAVESIHHEVEDFYKGHPTLHAEELRLNPLFDQELKIVFIGRISVGKSSLLNQLMLSGLVGCTELLDFSLLPVTGNATTHVNWFIRKNTHPGSNISVRAYSFNDAGQKEEINISMSKGFSIGGDLNKLYRYVFQLSKDPRLNRPPRRVGQGLLFGYVEIFLPEHASLPLEDGREIKWVRPKIFDTAALVDTPGLGENDEYTAGKTESYVRELAHESPCVFVWCVEYNQGSIVTQDCNFAVEFAQKVPESMLVVITKYNQALERARDARGALPPEKTEARKNMAERVLELRRMKDACDKVLLQAERQLETNPQDEGAIAATFNFYAAQRNLKSHEQELQETLAVQQNLRSALYEHQMAEEVDVLCSRINHLVPPGPVAFIGGAYTMSHKVGDLSYEFDQVSLWAFQQTVHHRFVKYRKVRSVLSELSRLDTNVSNYMITLLDMNLQGENDDHDKDVYEVIFAKNQRLKKAQERAMSVYDTEIEKLVERLCTSCVDIVENAHIQVLPRRSFIDIAGGATSYTRLLQNKLAGLIDDQLKIEAIARSNALRFVALTTYRWLCEQFPGQSTSIGAEISVVSQDREVLQHVLNSLDDLGAVTENLMLTDTNSKSIEIPMHSTLRSVVGTTSTAVGTKMALKEALDDWDGVQPLSLSFDAWTAGIMKDIVQPAIEGETLLSLGSPEATGLTLAMGMVGAGVARYLAFQLLGPAGWVVGLGTLISSGVVHQSWSYEEKKQRLVSTLRDHYFPQLKEKFRDERVRTHTCMKETVKEVIKAYVRSRVTEELEIAKVAKGSHWELLCDARSYKDIIREQLQHHRQEFGRLADDRNRLIEGIDPDKTLDSVALSDPDVVRKFLRTQHGEYVKEPYIVVSTDGKHSMVNGSGTKRLEPDILQPIPCHVTRFFLDQWKQCLADATCYRPEPR